MAVRIWNMRTTVLPKDAVRVDRATEWGNPFKIGKDGDRAEVIRLFREYALIMLSVDPTWLEPLRGKDLACWCSPEACHAEVLAELANAETDPPPTCHMCEEQPSTSTWSGHYPICNHCRAHLEMIHTQIATAN
jgi:hypothetical protein